MKENLNREFLDLRKFDTPINSLDLIKEITSNPNIENDPFYIVDLEDICNKHITWITRLPRVEPHYAVKCNTDPMLLKLLAYLGAGFDCASKNEIQTVLDLGVAPHRIIFANPCKQASNIKFAYKVGVDTMTFDNEAELYKIKEHHPNARVVLRIVTNDADAVCRFSMKFGAEMDQAFSLIDLAMRLSLDLVGISFHVGSGQMTPKSFTEAIQNARELFDYARVKFGRKMSVLDLGGGYPGADADLFDAISEEINRALEAYFPADYFNQLNGTDDDDKKFRIIAEPGRYYASSAFTLCVNVIAERRVAPKNGSEEALDSMMYYINDGVYASFNCLFYDHAEVLPILVRDHQLDAPVYKSSVWGPTCDGLDLVVKECMLPRLSIGEFLVFKNMGAYTISGAVAFNGIPLARCIYVASTSWNTIKNAFTDDEQSDELVSVLGGGASASVASCAAAANLNYSRALSSSNHHHQRQSSLLLSNDSDSESNGSGSEFSVNQLIGRMDGCNLVDAAGVVVGNGGVAGETVDENVDAIIC
jgi:ornithine decarboxylase